MAGKQPKLFEFNQERDEIRATVAKRVLEHRARAAERDPRQQLEYVLNEAAYQELGRLEKFGSDRDIGEIGGIGYWKSVERAASQGSDEEKRQLLEQMVKAYVNDIVGNFDPRVYKFASKVLPAMLSMLFDTQRLEGASRRSLRERIRIDGDLSKLKALAERGTLIVAPTHISNLDSIVVGWALSDVGLPPVTYGAGKNLFFNRLLSFFMHNLGAYKVDRRIRHNLYKECLKLYSEELLVRGFHSLFFPGGTRSRSGEVEKHLKLGLLGTGLTAYLRNLQNGVDRRIFLVPMTLNSNLVLEAEGLIHDYLRTFGREFYLSPKDPFDDPWQVLQFALKLANIESSMVIRLGEPMDILGNAVDAEGRSYDRHGREVSPRSYLEVRPGVVGPDSARDFEYTRQAGLALADAFVRETVLMPTQFVSYALFEEVRKRYPQYDLPRVLRFGNGTRLPWEEVHRAAGALRDTLGELHRAKRVIVHEAIMEGGVHKVVEAGLESLGKYHTKTCAQAEGESGILVQDMNLLFYYGNRLRCVVP
jgi:glycerol-3-phosphate O-acyltransferase